MKYFGVFVLGGVARTTTSFCAAAGQTQPGSGDSNAHRTPDWTSRHSDYCAHLYHNPHGYGSCHDNTEPNANVFDVASTRYPMCDMRTTFNAQERMLEYLIFETAQCIGPIL